MRLSFLLLPCTAFFALCLTIVPSAQAQSMSLDEVRYCLCQEDAIQQMRQDVAEKRSSYDGVKARLDAMQTEINKMRANMDPNDSLKVQLLAEQIGRRDQARQSIQANEYPALQSSIGRLNAAVGQYNQNCANRTMRQLDINTARADLQCPPAF